MKPFAILSVAVLLSGPALAGDVEFDTIVRRVEAHCDTGHTRIPFFGLANFVVKVVHPAGASDLKLAVFEDLRRPLFTQQEDFTDLMQGALGPGGSPRARPRSTQQ